MGEQPTSLTRAVRLLWLLVALGVVTAVLTWLLRDDLIRSWADGRTDERQILDSRGLQAVKDGTVRPPAFVPVAIVLCVVLAGLIWILLVFLRGGYGWARVMLTILLALMAVGTVAGLRTGPPRVFEALCLVSFVIEVATLAFLWHPDTGRYLRAPEAAEHQGAELTG